MNRGSPNNGSTETALNGTGGGRPGIAVRSGFAGGAAAVGRAVLGWIVLCAGIGLAITVAGFLTGLIPAPAAAAVPLVQAVLVTVLVVPAVLLLLSKLDRASPAHLGLSRRMTAPVVFGLLAGQ
ncbi:hypothetical protein QMA10_08225 [Arthrobacter sp. APC 3897]|uniref:hypothetical protein n=1 Tax=Arthrobacter sp. APC 3897 TaxID=3035204 RepID=UPI0025B4A228|nr:hypothetical protein [Arthrobacter sp. APC 3897]MDN3481909.1 hypothetical protein [Arthrobacter sp. APC 3897]